MDIELINTLKLEFSGMLKYNPEISINNGWYVPVYTALKKLQEHNNLIKVTQIKEKFGGLRIYTNKYDDTIDSIIVEAEKQCGQICEMCGKSGSIRTDRNWIQTLCDEHNI